MLSKFEILVTILVLVFLFFIVISFGAGAFSKKEIKPETKRYLKSVNILLIIIAVVGIILAMFI
tara:strand:- start:343 stop:534 length:192 start_codon:yes stop_codon:yes gene_type:complete